MIRLTCFVLTGLLLLLLTSACSKPAENSANTPATAAASPAGPRITSESVVSVTAQPVEISVGGAAEAVVRITIKNGYHTNANPPTFPYLKPTELVIAPAGGVSAAPVTYPAATARQFPFADKPLAVYEGEVTLKTTLKADKSAPRGQSSLSAVLRIQACDDQVCYPPGKLEVAVPVNIK
jgi:DsbC/DsbD-like thiol-disulfide interchange protein